jgi:hypothetical protein
MTDATYTTGKRGFWTGTPMVLAYILAIGLCQGIIVHSAWFGIGIAAAFAFYWLPSIIAYARHTQNLGQVIVLNLFGFMFAITWIVGMCFAFTNRRGQHS